MKTIKIIDDHPGKWQDGMDLVLIKATQLTEDGIVMKGDSFLTGFRPTDSSDHRGMFSETEEPMQVVETINGVAHFTMCHCRAISRDLVKRILAGSQTIISNFNPFFPVSYRLEVIE